MSDSDGEHSAESIGSNSSQSQSKSKKTHGKIKITTDWDSCTSTPSSNMDNACPAARGPPVLPSEQDLRVWRQHDEVNVKSIVESGTSSNKRLRPSAVVGDIEPFKGHFVSADSSPEISSTDYEYRKLVRIYHVSTFPGLVLCYHLTSANTSFIRTFCNSI